MQSNSMKNLRQDMLDIQRTLAYTKLLAEGKSPFLIMDREMAETYFPTQLRQALIDEILKDLEKDAN